LGATIGVASNVGIMEELSFCDVCNNWTTTMFSIRLPRKKGSRMVNAKSQKSPIPLIPKKAFAQMTCPQTP